MTVKRVSVMQIPVQLAAMLVAAAMSIPFAVGLAAAFPVFMAWRAVAALLKQSI